MRDEFTRYAMMALCGALTLVGVARAHRRSGGKWSSMLWGGMFTASVWPLVIAGVIGGVAIILSMAVGVVVSIYTLNVGGLYFGVIGVVVAFGACFALAIYTIFAMWMSPILSFIASSLVWLIYGRTSATKVEHQAE